MSEGRCGPSCARASAELGFAARPLRVLFAKEGRSIYGAEKATLRLLRHLDRAVIEPHLFLLEYSRQASELLVQARSEMPWLPVLRHPYRGPAAMMRELRHYLQQQRIDVLCTVGYKCDILGRLASVKTGVLRVSVLHGWVRTDPKLRLYSWTDTHVLRSFDGLITVSPALQKEACTLLPAERVGCIYNGVGIDEVRRLAVQQPAVDWSEQASTIVYVGRLSAEKGLSDLLLAFQPLASRAKLVLIGDGPLGPMLERQAQSLGISECVQFAGAQQNVYPFLAAATMLVLPSYTEGLPLVVLEALALGTPVVATRVGGVPSLIDDGRTGLLVPAGKPLLLRQAIGQMLDSPAWAKELGARGKAQIEQYYRAELVSLRFQKLLLKWTTNHGSVNSFLASAGLRR